MPNDFTDDANCVALWRMESGALTADSIGTNTLTDYGTVAEDAVNYKEGACSAVFAGSQALHIDDADLDAGVPLKNGDTIKDISVCGWVRPDVISGDNRGAFAKGDTGWGNMSHRAFYLTSVGGFSSDIFYDGDSVENLINSYPVVAQTGRWYHFGFTFHDATKSWRLVVWDATAGSKVVNATGIATNNINADDGPLLIGCGHAFASIDYSWKWNGLIDEVVLFNDILTASEIDMIRKGTYSWAAAHGSKFWLPLFRLLDQQRSGA